MKKWIFLSAIIFCLTETSPSHAAATDWMNGDQLQAFVKANMQGGKAYGTVIECKDGPMFRMTYMPFSGDPPFYRWQWVFGKTRDLNKIIRRLRLRGEPQRKYKIVQKHSYLVATGDEMTCAILYR